MRFAFDRDLRGRYNRMKKNVLIAAIILFSVISARSDSAKKNVSIDSTLLYKHVNALAVIEPPRYYKNISSLDNAADYIKNQFEKYTHRVRFQVYMDGEYAFKNVLASFGPKKGKRIIVGAHYDVCGMQPGADDNGSGVAALIELARLFHHLKPRLKYRIDLVAYTLEEPPYFRSPLMGSAVHAKSLANEGIIIKFMVSVDMIGYFDAAVKPHEYVKKYIRPRKLEPGNTTCIVTRKADSYIARKLSREMKKQTGMAILALELPGDTPGIDYSDHLNFWNQEYPAVMLTNFYVCPNPYYHSASDTIDKIDFSKAAAIVEGLYVALVNY